MRSSEDRLAERWCRGGDTRALARLFDRCAPRLLGLATRLAGDAEGAEDLVQLTFLALIEQRECIDVDKPIWPWLARVLANKARDARRRRMRERDLADPTEIAASGSSASEFERDELQAQVSAAIEGLPAPYREPMLLRAGHGLSVAEIASALSRSRVLVRMQLHRARQQLRRVLPAPLVGVLAGPAAIEGSAFGTLGRVRASVVERAGGVGLATASGAGLTSLPLAHPVAVGLVAIALVAGTWVVLAPSPSWNALARSTFVGPANEREVAGPAPRPIAPGIPERRRAIASVHAIRGRVVDGETGEPVAGARVRLDPLWETTLHDAAERFPELFETSTTGVPAAPHQVDAPVIDGLDAAARFDDAPVRVSLPADMSRPPVGEATSAADGCFTIRAGTTGVLTVQAEGYPDRSLPVLSDGETEQELRLYRRRSVSGRVVGFGGDSSVGPVQLALYGVRQRPLERALGPGELADVVFEGLEARLVDCAADGTFYTELAAGQVHVRALTPGWKVASPWIVDPTNGLEIEVHPFPVLRFLDADTGRPVERVRLVGRRSGDAYVRWSGLFSAPGGLLELPGDGSMLEAWNARPGAVFHAWSGGYGATRVPVESFVGAGVHDVELVPGAVPRLTGALHDGTEPAVGVTLVLLGHSPLQWHSSEDYVVDACTSDARGRFSLSAPHGRYVLRVEYDGQPYCEVIDLPHTPLHLDLARLARIDVRLLDEAGQPRPEHPLALHDASGRSERATTDEDGGASFELLSPGEYELMAPYTTTGGSFMPDVTESISLARGEAREVRLVVPVPGDSELSVRLLARDAASFDGWEWRHAYADRDWKALPSTGDIAVTGPRQGVLEWRSPERVTWSIRVPDESLEVAFDAGGGSYAGRLLDVDGSPATNYRVLAVPVDGHETGRPTVTMRLDRDGRFELHGLFDQEYHLEFTDLPSWKQRLASAERLQFRPAAAPGHAPDLELRIPVPGSQPVRGTVHRRHDGSAAAGYIVELQCEEPHEAGTYRVDWALARVEADGLFEIRAAPSAHRLMRVYSHWSPEGVVYEERLQHADTSGDVIEILVE